MLKKNSLKESVIAAMDGTDSALYPYIPYIMQDLWEIGSDPDVIVGLVRKHMKKYPERDVLDLGCGKGAVSVKLAYELGCRCLGIDAVKEFIDEAESKAAEYGVKDLCTFKTGDIRERVKNCGKYDIIIIGSIGHVLGDCYSTLTGLSGCLKKEGIIILDDGYIADWSKFSHPLIEKKTRVFQQVKRAGMRVIDEVVADKEDIRKSDNFIFEKIKNRCRELMDIYPDKKILFEEYIKNQEQENMALESGITCSTMIIKR